MRFAVGTRRLDVDLYRVGSVTPPTGIDQPVPPHGLQLLFVAIRADEDKIRTVQNGQAIFVNQWDK